MAFANIDLYLRDLFTAFIKEVREDRTRFVIDDLFGDRPEAERDALMEYLNGIEITNDIRDRGDDRRYLYVIDSFPMMELPFPQIGTVIAPEDTGEFFLGHQADIPPLEVRDGQGRVIAYDHTSACLSQGTYWTDIICNTKDEVVWYSRLIQRAIIGNMEVMGEQLGLMEPRVGMGDLKPEQEHFPGIVFARRVTLTAKVFNTWKKRIPVATYATGINKALEG